jgi:hypothetical protein
MEPREFITRFGLESHLSDIHNTGEEAFPKVFKHVYELNQNETDLQTLNSDEVTTLAYRVYRELLSQVSPYKHFYMAILNPTGSVRVFVKSNSVKDTLIRFMPSEPRISMYSVGYEFKLKLWWLRIKTFFKYMNDASSNSRDKKS